MDSKIVLGLTAWAAALIAPYALHLTQWGLLAVYLLLGIIQTFLILNVAHDSIHNAISHDRSVNALLAYIYDGCGVNSYLVRILHNGGHHSCINLLGEDDPLGGRRVFRFTRHAPKKGLHSFQHVYALVFYALFSIDYVFIKDFEDFFFPSLPLIKQMNHRAREYVILFGGKIVYLTCVVGLPIALLGYPPLFVILGFFLMHIVLGLAVALVFAPTHILGCNSFPESRNEYQDYISHIFATTSDYATESKLVTWLTGGLNHHIVHHICPHVCHVHYPQLTKIVKETAGQYQVPYKEQPTLMAALRQHFSWLKQLASET